MASTGPKPGERRDELSRRYFPLAVDIDHLEQLLQIRLARVVYARCASGKLRECGTVWKGLKGSEKNVVPQWQGSWQSVAENLNGAGRHFLLAIQGSELVLIVGVSGQGWAWKVGQS